MQPDEFTHHVIQLYIHKFSTMSVRCLHILPLSHRTLTTSACGECTVSFPQDVSGKSKLERRPIVAAEGNEAPAAEGDMLLDSS